MMMKKAIAGSTLAACVLGTGTAALADNSGVADQSQAAAPLPRLPAAPWHKLAGGPGIPSRPGEE